MTNRIADALKDAIAYASGDYSRGTATTIKVEHYSAMDRPRCDLTPLSFLPGFKVMLGEVKRSGMGIE